MNKAPFSLMLISVLWSLAPGLSSCRPPGQNANGSPDFTADERTKMYALSPLPSPPSNPSNRYADDPQAAHLGQYLFFDPRLSQNQKINCASCHNPGLGWSDQKALAQGLGVGTRNSPSLWNVAYQRWLFWDGRADSIWAQSQGPLFSAHEMGASPALLHQRFLEIPELKQGYEAVFGTLLPPKSPQDTQRFVSNIGKALEAYQRKIISTESDFDRFVKALRSQDPKAPELLSVSAQRGLRLFIGAGQCMLCHQGPLLSDGEFHNIGLPALPGAAKDPGRSNGIDEVKNSPWNGLGAFSDSAADDPWNDKLRYVKTDPNMLGAFRTPSLREIAHTAPYMHDGRFKTLSEVIQFYNAPVAAPALGEREDTLQPLQLTAEDMQDLEAFLHSLSSGPPSPALNHQPASPVGGASEK